ncbi:MAG: hypothetical protein ACLGHK_11805 [Alphaproteobacteria bacterium]
MSEDVVIIGAGMHPWGKWGRNFVGYGVAAAQEALRDAGIDWRDVQFVSGAATMRCGYPGYVAGATFAQALGWQGAEVSTAEQKSAIRRRKSRPSCYMPGGVA